MFDLNKFQNLSTEHQAFLQLLSIIALPIASTPLAQCANVASIPVPDGDPQWTSRSIKLNLLDLVKEKWLVIDSNRFSIPDDMLDAIMLYSLESNTYQRLYNAIKEIFKAKISYSGKQVWNTWENAIADIRMTLFFGDQLSLKSQLSDVNAQFEYIRRGNCEPLKEILGDSPTQNCLDLLADDILVATVLPYYSSSCLFSLENCDEIWTAMLKRRTTLKDDNLRNVLNALIAEQCLVRGDYNNFPERPSNTFYSALWTHSDSTRLLLTGQYDQALERYDQGIRLLRKSTKQPTDIYQNDIFEVLHFLQTLSNLNKEKISAIEKVHDALSGTYIAYFLISAYAEMINSGDDSELLTEIDLLKNSNDPYICLTILLLTNWAGITPEQEWIDKSYQLHKKSYTNGYYWLAAEFAEAIGRHLPKDNDDKPTYTELAKQQHKTITTRSLFDLITPEDRWKRSLNALNILAGGEKDKQKKEKK
ncbi:MAG TPA: hypothetical protein EYH35_05555, partial [Thiotrichaceae bacterium]|nr:hypothetical protein [Thiotrichaceae bacterium]